MVRLKNLALILKLLLDVEYQVNSFSKVGYVDLDANTILKRFVKMGDAVLLMPENSNYEPINVTETQMSILGVAVGIVKNINT